MISTDETEIDTMARTLFGEARGEYNQVNGGTSSLIAVGNVIINRMLEQTWYGLTVKEVCLKPKQFSCWNTNDPNYLYIKDITELDPIFRICLSVSAKLCANNNWPDLTKGANHYFSTSMTKPPTWVGTASPTLVIGRHKFYKLPS